MIRSAALALGALVVLGVVVTIDSACTGTSDGDGDGDGDGDVSCESPLDCALGESCLDGVCTTGAGNEGEGEGEGEGNPDDLIQGVCQRLGACQGSDPASCVEELTFQIDDMRARGTPVCNSAADSMLQFFACLNGLTCQQMQADALSFCPVGNEASNLQNQCFGGEGEGEGEGECFSDQDCPMDSFCIDNKCVRDG